MTAFAVLGMGQMGASIAGRLARAGARVVTCLDGRSEASCVRAREAGVEVAEPHALLGVAYVLSIVPPKQAVSVAQQVAGLAAISACKPVFVDLNAINVATSGQIGSLIAAAGCRYIDGCIIGMPGKPDEAGPTVYLSGEVPDDVATLGGYELRARSTGGPPGSASALKMAYAGFNKGLTGLAAMMILAASEGGAAGALRAELSDSAPHLLRHIESTLPDMYPKAWRWDFEMRQVGEFASQPDVNRLYQAMADVFHRLGQDWESQRHAAKTIDEFFRRNC